MNIGIQDGLYLAGLLADVIGADDDDAILDSYEMGGALWPRMSWPRLTGSPAPQLRADRLYAARATLRSNWPGSWHRYGTDSP